MGRSQNCHIFPIIEGQSVSSAYSMSHSQFHHSSYNLQAHEAVKFPSLCPSEHVFPLVLPSYPYQVDQIGNEIKTPNSLLRDIPDGVPSNGHVGDKVRNTCFMQSLGLSKLHEQERLHALITRAARTKRKMARQKSASLKRNLSNGGSSAVPSSNTLTACAIPTQSNNRNEHKDLYTFCTPEKRLRMLLTKELKKSDVGNLGRIVLPKREAEENLPSLFSKEGILIVIRDVYSSQEWSMRYRFWSNNNSRMYVLENTAAVTSNPTFILPAAEAIELSSSSKDTRPGPVNDRQVELDNCIDDFGTLIDTNNYSCPIFYHLKIDLLNVQREDETAGK
ncbi:hypothetical protein F0562_014025 [Nyssa sinensis]|uniref:TF-B3 domain-containing protein n=1 Tax=Nyssa sinensis TaxID=561372 RepID=A0A5J4ZP66_9ASTE|nr:hypothetical protein F0562_014025 [Nyssa sinensis]